VSPITLRNVTSSDWSGSHEPSKYVSAHLPLDGSCGTLQSPLDLSWCRWICLVEIFLTIPMMSLSEFRCVFRVFFLFFYFFFLSSLLFVNKKILKAHRSSGDDTTSTVEKISTRQIQRHQGRSWTVIGVCYISHSKTNEPYHIWTARVIQSGHRSWPILVLLDSSHRYLFNGTSCVII
jgi:hypothetical protein